MKWSYKIAEFRGIGVYVHATFLLLIGFIGISHWLQGISLSATVAGVGFILALFACVVAHEFGHALCAQKYGIRTRDITLLPIGGVARLERMPEQPLQELWVALAGPAVNVVIAAALFFWLQLTGAWEPFVSLGVASGSFLERLMIVNLFLVAFNLLPAFPMDGGRVLRALLATRLEYTRATQIAAVIGQGMAFLFGFIGLFSNPFLLFIAFFVWIGAAQEASMVQMKSALGGIPVRWAMLTDFKTVAPRDTLREVIALVLAGSQKDFPVTENGKVVGVLTQDNMIKALAQKGQEAIVADVMDRDFQEIHPFDMMESALLRLQNCKCHTLPVTDGINLLGLVTMDNIGELIRIQSALGAGKRRI